MRQHVRILTLTMLWLLCWAVRADELEDEIKRNLTPEHFNPASISTHTIEYVIKHNNQRIFIDGAELLRLNAAAMERGIKYEVVDFKMLQRSVQGSLASVSYRAKVSQRFEREYALTDTISQEIWERHIHGWVLLFAASKEVSSVRN